MEIYVDPVINKKANEEGATEEEIDATIRTGKDLNSESGQLGRTRVFSFKATRDHLFFEQKKLDVYFEVEKKLITVRSIDVFYGTFK